jgi:YegS/Rv2252/BmrU family lipid kinase
MQASPIQPPGARPAAFLVNANSRGGHEAFDEAIAALEGAGLVFEPRQVSSEEESAAILREEIGAGAPFVLVGGGDGTLSSCAGILAGTETALAALPMGTGNTLARSLGLPLDLSLAAEALAAGRVMRMDVGKVNGRVFVNSVTLGLSANIADSLDGGAKKRLGLLAWPVQGVRALLSQRAMRLRLTADSEDLRVHTRQLVIANGRYVAGPVESSPGASICNGLLDVFSLGGPGIASLLRGAVSWLLRRNRESPVTRYLQTRGLTVESLGAPVAADVDGEIRGTTPLRIECIPQALAVVVPADFKPDA